ncbi:helix-turn-helix domain-containing protein [Kineococcus sp. NPDC059986]|uniref:helix-turn-helix domain-containing protein n=1 Tax=Kineococcus sp. NPDC059986 TaxID=3155538 RepID=UPI00344D1BB0
MSDLTGRQPKALTSALELLEAVARAGSGVTAAELAAVTGLPRATAYRLLNLLVAEEHVVRLPDLSGFALGARVEGLVEAAAPVRVVTAAREELARLRSGVRAGVHLCVPRGGAVRVVDVDPDVPPPADPARARVVLEVLTGQEEARGEIAPGVRALAVAVPGPGGNVVGALLATSPASSATGLGGVADRLHATAKALGPLLE